MKLFQHQSDVVNLQAGDVVDFQASTGNHVPGRPLAVFRAGSAGVSLIIAWARGLLSVYGESANFTGLVLGCIETNVCK